MTITDDWNVCAYWILYSFSDLGLKLDAATLISYSLIFHAASAFYHSSHTKMQFYKNNDVIERNVAWSNWSHVNMECISLWILPQKFSWHPSEFAVAFLVPCLGPVATHIDRMPTVCQAVWTQCSAGQTRPLSASSLTEKSVVKQVRGMCWILWKKSSLQGYLTQFGGRVVSHLLL